MSGERERSKENRGDSNENIPRFYFGLDWKIMSQKHARELFRKLTVPVSNTEGSLIDGTDFSFNAQEQGRKNST